MHLADPTVDRFQGQVVYLDFDGQEDVTYNGPVMLEGIDVPAFRLPGALAGREEVVIDTKRGKKKFMMGKCSICGTKVSRVLGNA